MEASRILWLKSSLLQKLEAETFLWYPKETGGLLAGYIDQRGNIVVRKVTKSGPAAVHSPYAYTPDYKYDEKKIAQIYKNSERKFVYLGDWHTHPKSASYMSGRDKETIVTISSSRDARMPTPVMAILGTQPFQLRAWQLVKGEINEIQLAVY